jgi:hypothetical protein
VREKSQRVHSFCFQIEQIFHEDMYIIIRRDPIVTGLVLSCITLLVYIPARCESINKRNI